eukprot:638527-Pelagomonas_calceolata.AAC.2
MPEGRAMTKQKRRLGKALSNIHIPALQRCARRTLNEKAQSFQASKTTAPAVKRSKSWGSLYDAHVTYNSGLRAGGMDEAN